MGTAPFVVAPKGNPGNKLMAITKSGHLIYMYNIYIHMYICIVYIYSMYIYIYTIYI